MASCDARAVNMQITRHRMDASIVCAYSKVAPTGLTKRPINANLKIRSPPVGDGGSAERFVVQFANIQGPRITIYLALPG